MNLAIIAEISKWNLPLNITRQLAKKLVAKVHARISNARQDFLHKLSRKLTNESQVIVVEIFASSIERTQAMS